MKRWVFVVGVAVVAVVLVGGGVWWNLMLRTVAADEEAPLAAPTVEPLIRFSGEVKAKQYARLGFEATGVAKTVAVAVGDTVTRGQELVVLDRELQEAALASAYANRVSARDNALIALETAQSALVKTTAENEQTVAKVRQKVIDSKEELDDAKEVFSRTSRDDGDEAATTATKELAITTAEKAYNAAQEELTEARRTASKENTAATEAVRAAEASYAATTQASLNEPGAASLAALETSARVQLARKILMAPFDGTITAIDLEPNELALGGQPIITVQSVDDLEIEAEVSETDITKLSVGTDATVTFDALDDQEFQATITRIDPAGEKIDGVVRYTAYLDITAADRALRPGFTANVTVRE